MRAGRRHPGELRQGDLLQERLLERCSAEVSHVRLSEVRVGSGGGSRSGSCSNAHSGKETFVRSGARGAADRSIRLRLFPPAGRVRPCALLLGVLVASAALADVMPDDPCSGIQPGGQCVYEDGVAGTCVEVSYPVRPHPKAPLTTKTKVICKPTAAGMQRSALPWIGAGLSFLALCAGLAGRRRPSLTTA